MRRLQAETRIRLGVRGTRASRHQVHGVGRDRLVTAEGPVTCGDAARYFPERCRHAIGHRCGPTAWAEHVLNPAEPFSWLQVAQTLVVLSMQVLG